MICFLVFVALINILPGIIIWRKSQEDSTGICTNVKVLIK